MLTVSVLGPVAVNRDGASLAVPAGLTTDLLVRLALEGGRPLRVDRLLDDLWEGESRTARNTLQSKVSQLRRALGGAELVRSGPAGYALAVAPEDVDALAVVTQAEAAAVARNDGDLERAVELAEAALARFRGDVLTDVGDATWARPHRARLEEVRLGLVESRMAARVALGAGADVVGELRALVEVHPLREGLWSALVTALYRSGRQAEALAAYGQVRTLLIDELGVEPGPGLRRLEEQVLRQSTALGGGEVAALPVPGNLPTLTADLVGRGDDLTAVATLLDANRLVTLVGTAGVGKSRMAVEAGRGLRAAGGVWIVRLDAVPARGSRDEVARAVAETLQVSGGEVTLVDRLSGAEAVLVLDGCEHVAEAVAGLTAALLDGAPTLRVLATSQVPLGLDGEVVRAVEPLPLADATDLFVRRATTVRATAVTEDDAEPVEELCRALDGLPLAIELAAARARSLSVPEIARRLDDRFVLLRDPAARGGERRRGLGAAIGWSHDLLFPDDQRGLWALSVFAGGALTEAAAPVLEALGIPDESVLDVVDRLVERSLVSVDTAPGRRPRLRLLDSIRVFAGQRLEHEGLAEAARAAQAAWCAQVAADVSARVRGGDQSVCLGVVRDERANVDAALTWCAAHDPVVGLDIAVGLGWAWVVLGDGVSGAARVRDAMTYAADAADPGVVLRALLLAGWLEASAGFVERAEDDLARAEALLADGDDVTQADLHRHRAFLRIQQGRPVDVRTEADAALAVDRGLGRAWEVAADLLLAAYGAVMVGDTVTATAAAREAADLLAPLDDSWGLVHAHGILGAIAQVEHRLDDAAAALTEAAHESDRSGFLGQAALHLTRLGRVEEQRGNEDGAVATLDRALAAARRDGDLRIAATARTTLSRILRRRGDLVPALALLQQNDAWYRTAGGDGALLTRALLAALAVETEPHRPTTELDALLDEATAADEPEARLVVLDALARCAATSGDADAALQLLERADAQHAAVAHLVDESDRYDAHAAGVLVSRPQ